MNYKDPGSLLNNQYNVIRMAFVAGEGRLLDQAPRKPCPRDPYHSTIPMGFLGGLGVVWEWGYKGGH